MSTRLPDVAGGRAPLRESGRREGTDPLLAQRLDGLIGMLSHDLRTPLSAISGWLFLLESGKLDGEGQKRAIAKIRGSIDEQVRLIDDTLAISRSETGRFEIEAKPVLVAQPLAAAIDAARRDAGAKDIALDADSSAASVTIMGDDAALQRAIELVLAHAVAVTPAGGRIRIAVRRNATWLEIAIIDASSGFASADLPWVLDPFGRPRDGKRPSPRSAERGLLVAKALVVVQGGELAVASEGPGGGAVFTIALPLGDADAGDRA